MVYFIEDKNVYAKINNFYSDGLLNYIKNNVSAYATVTYPSVMKCIDVKLKQFMEHVTLEEGEKVQFFKTHDIEGIPSRYGKIYYAERRNNRIHLMATIKKGQKAGYRAYNFFSYI